MLKDELSKNPFDSFVVKFARMKANEMEQSMQLNSASNDDDVKEPSAKRIKAVPQVCDSIS
jgi:hypothetical protein